MVREHTMERVDLIGAAPNFDSLFARPFDLAAQLGRQRRPQRLTVRGEIEQHGQLAMRHRKIDRELGPAAELQELRVRALGERHGFGNEQANCVVRPQRAAVVQEGHRYEIMPEHHAPDSHERQDADERAGL